MVIRRLSRSDGIGTCYEGIRPRNRLNQNTLRSTVIQQRIQYKFPHTLVIQLLDIVIEEGRFDVERMSRAYPCLADTCRSPQVWHPSKYRATLLLFAAPHRCDAVLCLSTAATTVCMPGQPMATRGHLHFFVDVCCLLSVFPLNSWIPMLARAGRGLRTKEWIELN